VRCVNCGKLIQSGNLCKTCDDAKKISEENAALKGTHGEDGKNVIKDDYW